MSDKAKDWFQKNVFSTEDEVVFLVRGEIVDFHEIMQSYAEQHLEDVLWKMDKKELAQWQHNNYCEILLNNGLANENQLTPFHELSEAEQNAIEELTERLLNLLKQRRRDESY